MRFSTKVRALIFEGGGGSGSPTCLLCGSIVYGEQARAGCCSPCVAMAERVAEAAAEDFALKSMQRVVHAQAQAFAFAAALKEYR